MNADEEALARRLFERAADMGSAARASLLEAHRAEHPAAVAEAESLLGFHGASGAILDRAPVSGAAIVNEVEGEPAGASGGTVGGGVAGAGSRLASRRRRGRRLVAVGWVAVLGCVGAAAAWRAWTEASSSGRGAGEAGVATDARGRLEAAEESLKGSASRFGAHDPRTVALAVDAAGLMREAGRAAEAVDLLSPMVGAAEALGDEHPLVARLHRALAGSLAESGSAERAIPHARRVVAARASRLGEWHAETVGARDELIGMLVAAGRCDEAAAEVERQARAPSAVVAAGAGHGEALVEPQLTRRRFDVAACRGEIEAMRRWAERLRGTPHEREVMARLREAVGAGGSGRGSPP